MDEKERLIASIDQIKTVYYSQFTRWHLSAVKSIQKILLNLDDFYGDLISELEYENEQYDIVHWQIRNGWFYDAVAHAEQAIEDLFSMMMSIKDLATFTKDVMYYNASNAVKYIRNFNTDDLRYMSEQMGYCYCPICEDDTDYVKWSDKEAFEGYKKAILLTQEYLKELQAFHKKYYEDYCQYKHGSSVALAPAQKLLIKEDDEAIKQIMEQPLIGSLFTLHNGTVEKYQKRMGELPAMMLFLKPGMTPHVSELHKEGNLLFSTMNHVDIREVVRVTEHACILLSILWKNLISRCDAKEDDKIIEIAYPSDTISKYIVIGHGLHSLNDASCTTYNSLKKDSNE